MEIKNEIKTYDVKYCCDECGEEVVFTGVATFRNPQQFEHECKCGQTYWLNKVYPSIEYK